jgi:hypothetical protein
MDWVVSVVDRDVYCWLDVFVRSRAPRPTWRRAMTRGTRGLAGDVFLGGDAVDERNLCGRSPDMGSGCRPALRRHLHMTVPVALSASV